MIIDLGSEFRKMCSNLRDLSSELLSRANTTEDCSARLLLKRSRYRLRLPAKNPHGTKWLYRGDCH